MPAAFAIQYQSKTVPHVADGDAKCGLYVAPKGGFSETTQYSTRTMSVSDKNYASSVASKITSMRTGGGCERNRGRPARLTWYIVRLRSAGHPRTRTVQVLLTLVFTLTHLLEANSVSLMQYDRWGATRGK